MGDTSQLFVTKLPRNVSREELRDLFKEYGKIKEITVKRTYGFVEYYDNRDAEDAISAMDGKRYEGRELVVEKAGERKSRTGRGPQDEDVCYKC